MSRQTVRRGVYDLDEDQQSIRKLHPPGIKKSNLPIGNPKNPLHKKRISDTVLITTEIWDESIEQPWTFDKDNIDKRYKLKMRWEEGKNYAITEVSCDEDKIVYYYCDICSPITKEKGVFSFQDWYVDIIKRPYEAPTTEDENEFEEAVELGYLSKKEAQLATKTVDKLKHLFQDENSILKLL